jgi:hypothetical protein
MKAFLLSIIYNDFYSLAFFILFIAIILTSYGIEAN